MQDGGFLIYDADQQVVDVLLELSDLSVLPGEVGLLLHHQCDQLFLCQLGVRATPRCVCRLRGVRRQ